MGITNIEYIKEIARIFANNDITKIDISEGDAKILFEKAGGPTLVLPKEDHPPAIGDAGSRDIIDFNALVEVKSPLVGVFYSAPSPDAEAFVRIGDTVNKGDVLCIIESMKLLNEITAERDGEIVDICLKNGEVVEFGQVLLKMI